MAIESDEGLERVRTALAAQRTSHGRNRHEPGDQRTAPREAEVTASCKRQNATISAIETLTSGGTRVVLTNVDAADTMRRVFGKKVLTGAVSRTPLRTRNF